MNKFTPTHIGIIMDGNRRWARQRGLPVIKGHEAGAQRVEPLVEFAAQKGIRFLTFWAFSSENWNRGNREVGFLLKVFREVLKDPMIPRLIEKGVRVNVIGDLSAFPKDICSGVEKIFVESRNNKKITVTFALNYGGRQEILQAVKEIIVLQTSSQPANREIPLIDEKMFASYLYTKDIPDPDLLIRTGGEQRLSGFLPWQSVYSELYFTEKFWPDFTPEEFDKALEEFASRERRFGK